MPALFTACGGGGDTIIVTDRNAAPNANAGLYQQVDVGTTVTLDGSASSDPNGDPLTFSWTVRGPTGLSVPVANATSARTTFVASDQGLYTATLSVSDGALQDTSVTHVAAYPPNVAPVADAGADQSVFAGMTVTLSGSGSDANGDILTYQWVLAVPAGSKAALSDSTVFNPSFVTDVPGLYVASLTVNDGKLSSSPARVNVHVAENPWSSTVAMPTARTNVAAAPIGTKIYVLGGESGGTPVPTVEVFDTVLHAWSTAPPMPTARVGFAIAVLAGRIYTIGGAITDSQVSTTEVFDPAANLWATAAPMPTARSYPAASAINGLIFVVNGRVPPMCSIDWVCRATTANESYNPVTDTWTSRSPVPKQLIGPGSAALGSRIFVIGGERQNGITIGGASRFAFSYDPATDAWVSIASLPNEVLKPAVAVVGNSILVVDAPVVQYDALADTWTVKQAPSPGATGLTTAVVADKVYVFEATDTLIYDPAKDTP